MTTQEKLQSLVEKGFLTKEAAERIHDKVTVLWRDAIDREAKNMLQRIEKKAVSFPSILGLFGKKPVVQGAQKSMSRMVKTPYFDPKSILGITGVGALLALGAQLVSSGVEAVKGAYESGKVDQSFAGMMKIMPDLKGDPETKNSFSILSTFAPSIAQHPIVAASLVNRLNAMPGNIPPDAIKQLVEIQASIERSNVPIFGEMLKTLPGHILKLTPSEQHDVGAQSSFKVPTE